MTRAFARFNHGVSHHAPDPERRVGLFPDADGTLRLARYAEFDGSVVVDPLAWIATDAPADLGRWA